MNIQKLHKENCRICLEDNADTDWNDLLNDHEFLTYKDCYYKYTNLDAFDEENLHVTTTICRSCSDNLNNINAFVTKAIEIHNILQESIALKNEPDIELKTNFETIMIEAIDIKPETQEIYVHNDSNSEVSMYDSSEEDDAFNAPQTYAVVEEAKENEMESVENSTNEVQNDEKVPNDGKKPPRKSWASWKPWIIPTCCTICSRICKSKYKAIQHEKTHHKDRERTETCDECGMKFFDKTALRNHTKTHAKDRVKTKMCEFCDKAFYEKGALNIHRRIHLGQMVKCTLCTKEFYRQVDLDKHMISHSATAINNEIKPQKKYYVCCEFCGENIRSPHYKSHLARHNNEPLAKCGICNKEFFSRSSCMKHLKSVHRIEREEKKKFVIAYKTQQFTKLFLEQKAPKLFAKE